MRQDIEKFALSRELLKRTVALILAGGRRSRLQQLTDRRTKPAVYFGGKSRVRMSRILYFSPASGFTRSAA